MAKKRRAWRALSKKKRVIIAVAVAATVAGTAGGTAFYRVKKASAATKQASAQVVSAEVTKGTISNTITGSGTLARDDAESVTVPAGVTIDEVLVSSGDKVTEGQTLATVTQASVASAIADIQESIDSIDTQLAAIDEDTTDETVSAVVSGRVKEINMSAGDSVETDNESNPVLMTISADGLMAVDLTNTGAASTGDSVTVTLSDGTALTGTVASAAGDTMVVTFSDETAAVGDTVTVTDGDVSLGSGSAYVHQPLEITASSGTVSSIYVSVNESVSQGDELFYLTGVSDTTTENELLAERSELTDELTDMTELGKTCQIVAPYSGTVESVSVTAGEETSAASSSTTSTSTTSSSGSSSGTTASKTAYSANGGSASSAQSGIVTLTASSSSDSSSASSTVSSTSSAASSSSSTVGSASEDSTQTISKNIYIPLTISAGETASADDILATINKALASDTYNITAYTATELAFSGISEGSTFSAGSTIELYVTLTPSDGYAFAGSGNKVLTTDSNIAWDKATSVIPADDGTVTAALLVTIPAASSDSGSSSSGASSGTGSSSSGTSSGSAGSSSGTGGASADGSNTSAGGSSTGSGSGASSGTASASSSSGSSSGSSGFAAAVTEASDILSSSTASGSGASYNATTGSVVSTSDVSSGSSGTAASADSSADSSTSSASSSDSSDLYSSGTMTAFTVSTDEYMDVSISVDELDILSVEEGQSVSVALDAIDGQTFDGEVSNIDTEGTNSGGSTKYTVTVRIPKDDDMLVGMSATATITTESAEDVLTVPESAIQERGSKTYVYTENDDGTLSGETEVTTGVSDGTTVEITDGLSEGDTVYYSQLTGDAISTDNDDTTTQNMGGGMAMGGGGGDMPSGGGNGGNGGAPGGN